MSRYEPDLFGIARTMEDCASQRRDVLAFNLSQYLQDLATAHQPMSADEQFCIVCKDDDGRPCKEYQRGLSLAIRWLMDQVSD